MTLSIVASSDQLAVKEYELIRCFNAQSKQSEAQKILDEKLYLIEIHLDRLDCSDSLKEAGEVVAKSNKLK